MAFLFAVVNAPENGLIFIVGRTIQTIERNIVDVLQQPLGPFGPFARYVHHNRGANTATIFGRVVHLIGANDVRAEGRIRGSTAALILVDEATLIPEAFWTMCLSRLRVPGAKLLATTNPDSPQHWLRQKFLLRSDLNMRVWHFDLNDNPSLTADYINSLKAEYTGLFYRRFILGDWCLAEGAVFEAYDPDIHVVDALPLVERWISLGIDYGTVNPFAAELIALGVDGCMYVTNEYYYNSKAKHRQLSDDEYAVAVVDFLDNVPIPGTPNLLGASPQWTVIDPSAASFRLKLSQHGIASVLADNAVLPGVRLLAGLIATRRIKFHRSCTGLISELPGYSWDPKAAERGEDAPLKVADHGVDAARYGLVTTQAAWRNRIREPFLAAA